MEDPELEAMASVNTALTPLEDDARVRVLRWAMSRFQVAGGTVGQTQDVQADSEPVATEYESVGDLVHAAQAGTGPEHALVVGYWFQEIQGRDGWTGGEINSTLKNMGRGLANVTKTLDSLKARRPALVMQTAKSGRAQQARKTYKLTTAGVAQVRRMLTTETPADNS